MKEHVRLTIADLQHKLKEQEDQVLKTKRTINSLCEQENQPPLYHDGEMSSSSISSIRSDQFYGRPLATVMREYLKMRRAADQGAASVKEVYEALQSGGYKFGGKNPENSKRGLQISLAKNQVFHRIPSGAWGLSEWYPSAKQTGNDAEKRSSNGEGRARDDVVSSKRVEETSDDEGGDVDG